MFLCSQAGLRQAHSVCGRLASQMLFQSAWFWPPNALNPDCWSTQAQRHSLARQTAARKHKRIGKQPTPGPASLPHVERCHSHTFYAYKVQISLLKRCWLQSFIRWVPATLFFRDQNALCSTRDIYTIRKKFCSSGQMANSTRQPAAVSSDTQLTIWTWPRLEMPASVCRPSLALIQASQLRLARPVPL